MATIAQRLIAAGATPERARAFEAQFAASRPGLKPEKLEDAFDEELGAISASIWPNTFRPKDLDDAQTVDYFKGVYGEDKYNQIIAKAAPLYTQGKNSDNFVIKTIIQDIEQGIPLADSLAGLRTAWKTAELRPQFGNLTEQDAVTQLNKLYADYSKVTNAAKDFLSKDKYYKANLPNPQIKYGKTTDLAAGVIDFRTHPSVEKYITSPQAIRAKQLASTAPAGYIGAAGPESAAAFGKMKTEAAGFEDRLFTKFIESGATPFFDEVKRRESVKGKTIK